jgi:transposase
MGKVINVDLNGARNILHIPESLGFVSLGRLTVRDGVNGLKTQPMVYRWMGRAGWVRTTPTSNEAIRMKTVNHKPMNHPKTTPPSRRGGGQLVQHQRSV